MRSASARPAPTDAPWYVVPADDKENARLIVSQIVLDTLQGLKMSYPKTERRAPAGIAGDPPAAGEVRPRAPRKKRSIKPKTAMNADAHQIVRNIGTIALPARRATL